MTTTEVAQNIGKVVKLLLRGVEIPVTHRDELIGTLVPAGGPDHENTFNTPSRKAGPDSEADGRTSGHGAKRSGKDGSGKTPARRKAVGEGISHQA